MIPVLILFVFVGLASITKTTEPVPVSSCTLDKNTHGPIIICKDAKDTVGWEGCWVPIAMPGFICNFKREAPGRWAIKTKYGRVIRGGSPS